MTKPELEQRLQELENELSLVNEENSSLKETISKLEQEKRNLASANSENASRYVSARDECAKLREENAKLKQSSSPSPDSKLLAELKKEREVSTEQLMKLHNFTKKLLDQQASVHNTNIQLFNYIVKDIESY